MIDRFLPRNLLPRFLIAALLLGLLTPFAARADEPASSDIALKECLVIKPVGRGNRSPLHQDGIEAEIVAGRWTPPKAGDTVQASNGKQTWEAAAAKDGKIQHAALGGGYLYWNVPSDTERVMILEAAGHGLVYVNGEPRVGDPYSNGIVQVPVLLHKGSNDFLFVVGRGQLQAKLVKPKSKAMLNTRDLTVPDYIVGESRQVWAAIVVINADTKPLEHPSLYISIGGLDMPTNVLPTMPPLSVRKVAFRLSSHAAELVDHAVELTLTNGQDGKEKPDAPKKNILDTAKFDIRQRKPDELHKRTFISDIDGSVQYYAVQPANPITDKDKEKAKDGLALFLTLHGASVEGLGQAAAYGRNPAGHIVAPTNRRPYGFDWEDWGRLDAMEVLDIASKDLKTDPRRTYLTGHSMGGHGTWQVGVTFPDRFAAIAPSAGWISFASYAGGSRRPENPIPMQSMLFRAGLPSDTLSLERNYANYGVYILHGDADDNVPVEQARTMRKELGAFHSDFAYYERPGAGHWWGNACVDWPPLFDFLLTHALPDPASMPKVDFVTASPAVSATYRWATIEAQTKAFELSSIQLKFDAKERRFNGKTKNVARLSLDLSHVNPGEPLKLDLDGQTIDKVAWPEKATRLWLQHEGDKWTAWSFAKARYDAETFWYRGNGSIDVIADVDFDLTNHFDKDRNVIVYGNADTHALWKALLGDSPVQVKRGEVQVGDKTEKGDDLACLFVRPRPGSDKASVGVVSGSGLPGMRLTERMPYFVSGVAFPDCLLVGAETLTKGVDGVRMAGFFGNDWSVKEGEFVWK
jgi:pimeloyl-ACP methyl ester carboxylesterase